MEPLKPYWLYLMPSEDSPLYQAFINYYEALAAKLEGQSINNEAFKYPFPHVSLFEDLRLKEVDKNKLIDQLKEFKCEEKLFEKIGHLQNAITWQVTFESQQIKTWQQELRPQLTSIKKPVEKLHMGLVCFFEEGERKKFTEDQSKKFTALYEDHILSAITKSKEDCLKSASWKFILIDKQKWRLSKKLDDKNSISIELQVDHVLSSSTTIAAPSMRC